MSLLRELIDSAPAPAPAPPAQAEPQEHCELCGIAIPPQHRHVLDLHKGELLCACRACQVLFDRDAAGGGHWRLVPERNVRLDGFQLDDMGWLALGLPVEMAFFVRSGADGRVRAFYPSPAGATESQLELEAWGEVEALDPALGELAPDVEALLVNRAGGARDAFLVGIDHCYRLVGLVRMHWRGFGGGDRVWQEIAAFFDDLRAHAEVRP